MKILLLKIIKRTPINYLRIFLYKYLFGYKIGKNVIIKNSLIICSKVNIEDNVSIGSNNVFSCNKLVIKKDSKIFSNNIITGKANFYLGKNSRIINNHFFDLWNDISIGNNSWIAGRDSQFWTHGSLKTKLNVDLSISIGDDVYIGSGVRISPGVKIASNNLVGLGSVLNGTFEKENTIIANSQASVIKENINWKLNW